MQGPPVICDCCGEPATVLSPGPVETIQARPKATQAERDAAPRTRDQWCEDCVRGHEKWKRKNGVVAA